MRRVFAGIALSLALVTLGITQRDLQNPIEQQTCTPDRSICGAVTPEEFWVVNSAGCFWDADDWLEATFSGRWVRGESRTYSDCVVTDHVSHVASLALPPGLTGHVTIDGINVGLCGLTHDWGDRFVTETLPEIAGSNGGHGVIVPITWTVENPGHTRKATAYIRIRPSWNTQWLCP